MSATMAGPMSVVESTPGVHRTVYPSKGPLTIFACCACHHLRTKGSDNCTNCNHQGYCCVHCKPEIAPAKWNTNEVPVEYEAELRRHQAKQVPALGSAVNYGEWVTLPLVGEEEEVRRRATGHNGPKHWILVLLLVLVVVCLDRSYQARKSEHQLAAVRAQSTMPFKEWRLQQQKEIEEIRRLLNA